jgi:SAM-dependent methyltransferase
MSSAKLSMKNLERLGRDNASDGLTLVVHSEFKHEPFFPNTVMLPQRMNDTHLYFDDLRAIEDNSYDVVLCSGLLEHMMDPQALLRECRRVLRPGGKLVMSVSAVFSIHRGPDNYFHFMPFGIRALMEEWAHVRVVGSSQPFDTIGILIQRILMQSDIVPPARPFIELLARSISFLDIFILRQYDGRKLKSERQIDSMMPSNLHVVAVK